MGTKFEFSIDRGGTFTDIYARCPGGRVRTLKLLSSDPDRYPDAPTEGIRRILEQETGRPFPAGEPIDTSAISWIRMGTTVATNALLEKKGAEMALLITAGFRDVLHIGNQARPKIFDLSVSCPDVLYRDVVEVDERLFLASPRCQMKHDYERVTARSGQELLVVRRPDLSALEPQLQALLDRGITSLAVVLMHSYLYPDHEQLVGGLAARLGFTHVSLSSEVMSMARLVPRGFTAAADAYLTPCIKHYLKSFSSGFRDELRGVNVLFMQSDGGLTPMDSFNGSRAILSGPAGGVVGYAQTTHRRETQLAVIGFDMGGTSTDVSRFDGAFEHVFESTTAGVVIQAPQLDVNTVAAGGGSVLAFRDGLFAVGPESAGAHPGPVCYKKGGPLTVTDANLVLGRLLPDFFPRIFGPNEDQPLDSAAAYTQMQNLTNDVNKFLQSQKGDAVSEPMSVEEVAMGFIRVANETMCRPIRSLTQARGHDTSQHALACFGGAGGQHACAIARALGMGTVFVHRYAGILSAFGMALADVVHEAQEPCGLLYGPDNFAYFDERLVALSEVCREKLRQQGFTDDKIVTEVHLHMRYDKTDCALMIQPSEAGTDAPSPTHGDFMEAFLRRYRKEFGFVISDRDVVVDDVRVRGRGLASVDDDVTLPPAQAPPSPKTETKVYFVGGYRTVQVYLLSELGAGQEIAGPAIIMDSLSTILVEPDCTATITSRGDVRIRVGSGAPPKIGPELDSIQLSIFGHRFMSLAEQMGRILQRTSISTNIKERLDFSCALFGPDGGLVSNAPHIPVHLGAMQEAVQYQMRALGSDIRPGDVLLSNHPAAGGSHLPDLTVITPVFYRDSSSPVFFVASRGHHADIGGITPGSMPPHSTSLLQEGACFKSFKLVSEGVFQEQELTEALMAPGKIPGSSGTRNLRDNLSDLRAQVAANQKGISLVGELIDQYTLPVVQAYMAHIQHAAELAVRGMLRQIGAEARRRSGAARLLWEDRMDGGSVIRLEVQIDEQEGSAVFDFSGTGYEVYGNCNAPRAITLSAVIYCLRCMVGHDVPLNQGCLAPIRIRIPSGSLLDPSDTAAVVGGNVLTSQRVVDVVLGAFGACAASQGCMNNVTFGDGEFGYYETVAGGAGAGPTWHGRSGVHSHMTNTRITDPEIIEARYPVVVQKFSLNPGTGGNGRHRGGDGVVRELLFRKPLTLSILTERRVFQPYGLKGGGAGRRGQNLLLHADGRTVDLGAKTSVDVQTGDTFRLLTPGGGGFGSPDDPKEAGEEQEPAQERLQTFLERGSLHDYQLAQESV
ncbi:5-oxoprolinase-like [Amphibalanus amphitrite]|uniref:5-oxoprolinase-like n=1 Tax=Amphibalanus amphitrite TaxID=1232801 RepID=UPI001C8FCC28|nr:5-oxoprolinase-like [Amphibalanus amphitrite]XP_043192344.1 5-oxoprolinase-like [Amphibalanus amphitrite]